MERIYSSEFFEFLQYFPAIARIGARQCGKTTLAKLVGQGWDYFDMEKMSDRSLVERDPEPFLKLHPNKFIIDEDRSSQGRFILTGSSSPNLLRSLSESLAGRIATIQFSPPFPFAKSIEQVRDSQR